MKDLIKVELVKYRYVIDGYETRKDDVKKYNETLKDISKQGHVKSWKCYDNMGQVNKEFYNSLGDYVETETKFLFNNQFNTKCGKRVFLWSENIYPNKDVKEGYYLKGEGLKELIEAQKNQLVCGYCGARYNAKETTRNFCDSCLDSKYLEEKDLYLLRLLPVNDNSSRPKEITDELKAEYQEGRKQLVKNQIERKKRKAKKLLEDLKTKHKKEIYETKVKHDLLMLGISIDNLIYYSHKDSWVYGWRDAVSEEDYLRFRDKVTENQEQIERDEYGIDLHNKLSKGKGL